MRLAAISVLTDCSMRWVSFTMLSLGLNDLIRIIISNTVIIIRRINSGVMLGATVWGLKGKIEIVLEIVIYFFVLTQKSNKKSQERNDIQHVSFFRLDLAVVLL